MTISNLEAVDRVDNLTDRAYARVRQALMTGTFSPGQKLSMRTIASVLGVSLTPARDAFNRLVTERALEMTPSRTVYVPKLTRERLQEIYRLRVALEIMAAEAAVPAFDKAKIADLERIQLNLVAAYDRKDYKLVLQENEKFHFLVYRASELPIACNFIENLWLQIGPSLNFLYPEFDRTRRGVNAHQALIAALKRRDVDGVKAAVEQDLKGGEERLLRVIEGQSDAAGKS